jgi:hypothetical protein
MVLGEVFYQTFFQGFNASLVKDKKMVFIPYGFHIRYYFVKDAMWAKKEVQIHLEYMFPTCRYKKNDPKELVPKHVIQVVSYWPYAHDSFDDGIFTKNSQDWEEFLQMKSNSGMTEFRSMSRNEQIDLIEKTSRATMRMQLEREREEKATRKAET